MHLYDLEFVTVKYFEFRPQPSKFIDWLPKFSLRVPRSNSFHVPKELRSSDENVNVSLSFNLM